MQPQKLVTVLRWEPCGVVGHGAVFLSDSAIVIIFLWLFICSDYQNGQAWAFQTESSVAITRGGGVKVLFVIARVEVYGCL